MYLIATLHAKERRERERGQRKKEGKKEDGGKEIYNVLLRCKKWITKTQYFYVGSTVSNIT